MNQPSAKPEEQVPKAFLELRDSQREFSLAVEGARNLPHLVSVINIDEDAMQVVLKTFRPMPPNLAPGAPLIASVAALKDYWKARLIFQGRTGYLQYLFKLPKTMKKTGRREHTRYQFRPRENVNVYAQDAALPGMRAVGTLFDLSAGGLIFRPERAYNIEDKSNLVLNTAMFAKGTNFPLIRIEHLPGIKGPLTLRGEVAHVSEKDGRIFVAFAFGLLEPSADEALFSFLEIRKAKTSLNHYDESSAPQDGAGQTGNSGVSRASENSTRRRYKRFPFRPRESAYVHVQNASLPGIGAAGPLFDLSAGGMVFRPDNIFSIGDGARLALNASVFNKGASFPVITVEGLEGLHGALKLRGEVAHVIQKDGDIFVAFVFGALEPWMAKSLSQFLEARKKRRRRFSFQRYLDRPY
ncbi:MAG: PilZ domain-containing protein [Holophagales bacterium]|nr:PilZ domain-containing protein [Holophagales bacterium]